MQVQYSWVKLHKYMNSRKSASSVLSESNKFHILEVNQLSETIWEGTALVLTTDCPLPVWKPLAKHLCSTRCQDDTVYEEHAKVSQKHCRSVEGNSVALRFVFQDKLSLCSPSWSWIHNPSASASQVTGITASPTEVGIEGERILESEHQTAGQGSTCLWSHTERQKAREGAEFK